MDRMMPTDDHNMSGLIVLIIPGNKQKGKTWPEVM